MAIIVQPGITPREQVRPWALSAQWRCHACQCLFMLNERDTITPLWAERTPDGNQGAEVQCPNENCKRVLEIRKHSAPTNGTYAPGSGKGRTNAWA